MDKYKPELLFFSILAIIAIIFSPTKIGIFDSGYKFFFTIRDPYSINYLKLLVELLLFGIITILFHYIRPYLHFNIRHFKLTWIRQKHQNSAEDTGKIIDRVVITFLSSILVSVILVIWYLVFPSIFSLIEPINPVTRITEKYSYALSYLEVKYPYSAKSIIELANKVLNNPKIWVDNFPLAYSLVPDLSPYYVDYKYAKDTLISEDSSFNAFYNSIDWEGFGLDTFLEIHGLPNNVPKMKTIKESDTKKIIELITPIKEKYFIAVSEDFKNFLTEYPAYLVKIKHYKGYGKILRILTTVLIGIVLFWQLIKKTRYLFLLKSH